MIAIAMGHFRLKREPVAFEWRRWERMSIGTGQDLYLHW